MAAAFASRSVCRRSLSSSGGIAPGVHQTPIVDLLWKGRADAKKERLTPKGDDDSSLRKVALEGRPPERSSVLYNFADNEGLREKYRDHWGNIRPERLLEDLDALAGTIAFKHCVVDGEDDPLIVTASVDRIVYAHRPDVRDDITLEGKVTWVGRSSMEIEMQACSSWTTESFLKAYFTFVARDPETNRATQINPLITADDESRALFELGRKRDAARKEMRRLASESVVGVALDAQTLVAANDLMNASKLLLTMPTLADKSEVLLDETILQNAFCCMPQQRNTAGRVFGGFLMRRAFELAFSTVYIFAGRRPVFLELDEVQFKSPVNVGDLLRLESCVLYTSEEIDLKGRATVHVEVLAHVMQPEKRTSRTSNKFNFTFGVAEAVVEGEEGHGRGNAVHGLAVDLRRVLPSTNADAWRAMTQYKADLAQRAEDEARIAGR